MAYGINVTSIDYRFFIYYKNQNILANCFLRFINKIKEARSQNMQNELSKLPSEIIYYTNHTEVTITKLQSG